MLNDKSTIKDFELTVRANKMTMDKLNRAYYGMTFGELVMAALRKGEDDDISGNEGSIRTHDAGARAKA